MKRGNLVTIAMQGDFGKPRLALVIQSSIFNEMHATTTVLLLSSELIDAPLFRLDVSPNTQNGLTKPCQIQVDKIMSIRSERIGKKIGELDDANLLRVNRALAVWLGLA
jgi:mRNA interferase MazF